LGKSKRKTHSEVEHLRGENRRLEQENRSLKRRLRDLEKYPQDEEIDDTTEDTHPKIENTHIICTDCGKGKIKIFEIIGKQFEECDTCGYRKKISG